MKLLIADDDRTSRVLLAALAGAWGFEPLTVGDGWAAWEALQQAEGPRLALLDWNMPVLDGLEVCRRVRAESSPNPPYVILLTGRTDKEDIVRGLAAGANDYVAKPFDSQELQARIQVGRRTLELQAHLLAVQEALARQATHDSLTGLLNRRAIVARLADELSRAVRNNSGLTVGLCDLDHFKAVNDTHGHSTGDAVLMHFAGTVQSQLRSYDSVGRYGGEEFLVVAPGIPDGRECRLFERLCALVSGMPVLVNTCAVRISVSIGVASADRQSTLESLLAAADEALYRAKADGRNRVAYGGAVGLTVGV